MIPALLDLNEICVRYGRQTVVDGLSFRLAHGEIGCLLGHSGCGKTTVLRAIAGFEAVTGGDIHLNGSVISRAGWQLPAHRRGIGMVFQDYALFPHLTVSGNIMFGLGDLPSHARQSRTEELLSLVGLTDRSHVYPHELSGGQQQRVALARALAPCPGLLLLDEPFSNLDVELRDQLGQEVRAILKREGVAALLVTHDQREAFAMADRIGVMRAGRIEQWADAYTLYHQPATRFVADFVGEGAFLPGIWHEPGCVALETGDFCQLDATSTGLAEGCRVDVLLRPDDVQLEPGSPTTAEVVQRAFRGAEFLYTLRLDSGSTLLALAPSHQRIDIGCRTGFRLVPEHLVAFPATA